MRKTPKNAWITALTGIAGFLTGLAMCAATTAMAGGKGELRSHASGAGAIPFSTTHTSMLTIRAGERMPQTRAITLGANKSMVIELPHDLRDVLVSDPEFMDAVVQTSNRVYLIGKKIGQSNAFFFDMHGQRILTLEVVIEPDSQPLDALLNRLLPGARIKSEV